MGTPKARRRKKRRFREAILKKELEDNIQCTVEEPITESIVEEVKVEGPTTEDVEKRPNALKMVDKKITPKTAKPARKSQTASKPTTRTTTKKKTTRRRKSTSTS